MLQSSQVGSALAPDGADEARNRELREGRERLKRKIDKELGPSVRDALADERTTDVMRNEDGALCRRGVGEAKRRIGAIGEVQAESLVRSVAGWNGKQSLTLAD